MKVSIITAVYNNSEYIEDCMQSVLGQSYNDIEYIIVDGGSGDGTLDIVKRYERRISKLVSEPDYGIYDALNKGIKMATGEVIGFLHADDMYTNNGIIETVASKLESHDIEGCYGDLIYVDKDKPDKIVRYWKSNPYRKRLFQMGWMPPHPTFFAKKEVYEKYGSFNTKLKISADYELMLRLFEKCKISTQYIPDVLIKMRMGGKSNRNIKNMIIKTTEDCMAWKMNNLHRGFFAIPLKNIIKIPQFFKRGDNHH